MNRENQKLLKSVLNIFGIYCTLHAGIVSAQEAIVLPGTKTPYCPQQRNYTVPPAGYFSVFINYVERHGSRFLTKEGTDKEVLDLLSVADNSGSLTATGKRIMEMAGRLYELEKGNYENISLSGKEEQKGIGERMLKSYDKMFDGRGINVQFTKKIRTQQSSDAFLAAFSGYHGKVNYINEQSMQDDVLRFYDGSPAYLEYKKSKQLETR